MTGEKNGSKEKEERTCTYQMHHYKPCGRDLYDGEYCIFHSENVKGKKGKFDKMFWLDEFEKQQKEKEIYDFTGFVFPEDFSFEGVELKKVVIFKHAKFFGKTFFKKTKFFRMVSFENAQFLDEVNFRDVKFSKWMDFMNAKFKVAHFEKVQFPGEVCFAGANFFEDAFFWGAIFSGFTRFDKAHFHQRAAFGKAIFEEVLFNDAQFSVEAVFELAQFQISVSFVNATFSEEAAFSEAQFPKSAYFGDAKFSGKTLFKEVKFSGKADFRDTKFSGEVSFFRSTFSGEKLTGLFDSLRNRGIKRILKGRYKIKNDFRFHLGGKIAKEFPVIERMTKDAWYLNDFKDSFPIIYWIWRLLADCGRSFFRWSFLSLIFVLFFAVNFCLIDYAYPTAFSFDTAIQDRSLWSFIYYSVVTFTTLGFGDIIPTFVWIQRWVMVEVIMGYIMLGGLISILANKLARRS